MVLSESLGFDSRFAICDQLKPEPICLESQHILHREPAAAALDPLRRGQRAAREAAAVARRMRQRNRFRRSVETNRVRAGNVAGPRRRHVDRPRDSRPPPSPASASAPCRTARPSSSRDGPRAARRRTPAAPANSFGRARHQRLEQHDAGREVRRRDDADARRRPRLAAAPPRAPASRSCRARR